MTFEFSAKIFFKFSENTILDFARYEYLRTHGILSFQRTETVTKDMKDNI